MTAIYVGLALSLVVLLIAIPLMWTAGFISLNGASPVGSDSDYHRDRDERT